MVEPLTYYSNRWVAEEIAAFLKGRWAALEGPGKRWARWYEKKPLTIESASDVTRFLRVFHAIKPRTFYGTIELFKKLESHVDVEEGYESNVEAATVFIDIDITDETKVEEGVKFALEAARVIGEWLENQGVSKSLYFLWSGAGIHVRIHEKAIDYEEVGAHPIDAAFALAELILSKLETRLWQVVVASRGLVKIENLVAPKRVFTAPLSLHRKLDRVAVTFKLNDIDNFELSWCDPEKPRHDPQAWRVFLTGEATSIAKEALAKIGRVKKRTLMEARASKLGFSAAATPTIPPVTPPGAPREPGRFPVMALLQAARYYLLYGDLEKAKSFGLNRAIFYAWAKYYGPAKRSKIQVWLGSESEGEQATYRRWRRRPVEGQWRVVAGERVQVGPEGWFMMGGIEQRPEDFERQVARRFEEAGIPFEKAWEAALKYLRKFPKSVLMDPQKFYKEVYEPVRDRFVERVLRENLEEKPTLDKWFKKKSG